MRILHTSDWHIGRTFHGNATLDALREVLSALTTQVQEHRVDVVVVAGDVFDHAVPSAAAHTLLTDSLVALRESGARVVVTSGNHDSAARLGFQAPLLREGIHVLTDPATIGTPVTIDHADGPVHFYGIPFLEPVLVRQLWPEHTIRTQRDALTHAMDLVRADAAERVGRSVAIAHCFAAGVEATPDLERDIQQGGLDVVPLSVFDGVDYAALGHIHGRKQLSERVRYAGAPLHYSFGEAGKPRGSWLVDLDRTGRLDVQWLDLPVPRRLVVLEAPLAELLSDDRFTADEDAWVLARYTDATLQREPMRRLRERFPYCAQVAHVPPRTVVDDGTSYARRVASARDDVELIDAFLRHVRGGAGATERERELLREVVDEHAAAEAVR